MPKPRYRSSGVEAALERIPAVAIDDGRGDALKQVGDVFLRGALVAKDYENRHLTQEGATKGAEAGFKSSTEVEVDDGMGGKSKIKIPAFMREDGVGHYATAYNRSQLAVYSARLESVVRDRAVQIGARYRDDPTQMGLGMERFLNGISETVPFEVRAQVLSDGVKIVSPYIVAAQERLYKAQEADTKATLSVLQATHGNDAQTNGQMFSQGGEVAKAAMISQAAALRSFMDQLALRTDGVRMTVGEAAKAAQAYGSHIAERLTIGMFDGTKDKDAMYARLLNGELEVDVPTMVKGPGGYSVEVTKQNLGATMDQEAQARVKAYMGSRLADQRAARTQARDDQERAGKLASERDEKDALLGKPGAAQRLLDNPYATSEQYKNARLALIEPPFQTNGRYKGTLTNQILNGEVTDIRQVDMSQLSTKDRIAMSELIDKSANTNHWSKSTPYTNAIVTAKMAVTGVVSDLASANVIGGKDRSNVNQEAAVRFIDRLATVARGHADAGAIIGDNVNGQVVTEVKGPKGETIKRFDPGAWVKSELVRIDTKLNINKEAMVKDKREVERVTEEWQNEKDPAKRAKLEEQKNAIRERWKASRIAARAVFINEEP